MSSHLLRGNEVAESEAVMSRSKLEVGMSVVFIDENYLEHHALLTAIHGDPEGHERVVDGSGDLEASSVIVWPCVNLVFADPEPGAQDQYGRQLKRDSSCAHWLDNSARGHCWRLVDEKTIPQSEETVS